MTLTDGLERQTTLIARPADSSPRNKKCSDSNKIPSARSRAPDSRLGCRVILDDDPGHLLRAPTSGTYGDTGRRARLPPSALAGNELYLISLDFRYHFLGEKEEGKKER